MMTMMIDNDKSDNDDFTMITVMMIMMMTGKHKGVSNKMMTMMMIMTMIMMMIIMMTGKHKGVSNRRIISIGADALQPTPQPTSS